MKHLLLSLVAVAATFSAQAQHLWVIGDGISTGWSTDYAPALLAKPGHAAVYEGVLQLQGGKDFKFMTVPDWGNPEWGVAPDATLGTDGTVALATGTNDTGYGKLQVPETANYHITIDTDTKKATLVKTAAQDAPATVSSLFMVGSAMPNGWDVMKGTPMYQDVRNPWLFTATAVPCSAGSFKIAETLRGASSFDSKYWYFRSADDAGKMAKGQDGDLQWNITEPGDYTIVADLRNNTLTVTRSGANSVDIVATDAAAPEYYTLQGVRVETPTAPGLYIRRCGNTATKVAVR